MKFQFHKPVAEAVPEIPPCNPILFVDVRHVPTHFIVGPGLGTGIVHYGQNLEVLGGLRNLVPLERSCYGWVQSRVFRKVAVIPA